MIIPGRNIIISVGGTPLMFAKSGSIELDADLIEVAPTDAATAHEYMIARLSWKVSTMQLLSSVRSSMLSVGQKADVTFSVVGSYDGTGGGQAIVTKCSVAGVVGSLSKVQLELTGTGRMDRHMRDLFLGTVLSEYVCSVDGKKLRIQRER